ncbi:MAG TPA: DUF4189 domain-containing protein [Xanthobacteraceae bacterium]|nr:DUF4189 domain-containing protein [Xanthobacteraceae bacterium]
MIALLRSFALTIATACILIAAIAAANAAGAFAVGACGAYGYAYDYKRLTDARAAAAQKCSGTCKIVGAIRRGCAALAVDAKHPCGSYGWALNSHLGKAENTSLRRCHEFGGRDCVVRAWACDEKG